MAKEADSKDDVLLLMMNDMKGSGGSEIWYLDSGCSNHMTSHREWLIHFDKSRKSQIRFADNRIIQAEGTGDILIRRKDGNKAMIKDVLYVPAMKSNLISIGQLIEKSFSMNLHQGILELYDPKHRKVLKTPLSANRTFQVTIGTLKSQCLSVESKMNDSWIWHMRYGHLNFKDLSMLHTKNLVNGLPQIKNPQAICERCLVSK